MQSGSDRSEWAIIKSNNDAKHYAQELARELGCPTGDMFRLTKCLTEHRSFGEIVNASSKVRLRVSITHSSRPLIWTYPCIDKIMKIKSLWMFKVMKMKLNSIIQNDYLYFSTKQDCFVCVCTILYQEYHITIHVHVFVLGEKNHMFLFFTVSHLLLQFS